MSPDRILAEKTPTCGPSNDVSLDVYTGRRSVSWRNGCAVHVWGAPSCKLILV